MKVSEIVYVTGEREGCLRPEVIGRRLRWNNQEDSPVLGCIVGVSPTSLNLSRGWKRRGGQVFRTGALFLQVPKLQVETPEGERFFRLSNVEFVDGE